MTDTERLHFRTSRPAASLFRYLNITSVDEALAIVTRYYDESQLAPKTRLALDELLPR